MLDILLVFLVGLTPLLVSLWMMRKAERQGRERLVSALEIAAYRTRLRTVRQANLPPEHQYIEGVGLVIGDMSCRFNARSSYLRCATNPLGPCRTCSHYQPTQD